MHFFTLFFNARLKLVLINFSHIQIFDNFRKCNPDVFDKIVAIEGDVGEENIGISETDKITILNEVSIVFHNAALLKMDATLSQAINVNTKGVIRMLDIAMEMKNLDVSYRRFFLPKEILR